ncbi:MAG: energy-coupling factor transporter transmembrane component T [Lachnospiraceae bacterium]
MSAFSLDPRTKLFLLIASVLSATMAPNLTYELGLVLLIAVFALSCGKTRTAFLGTVVYVILYLLTNAVVTNAGESVQAVLLAFFGLIHKVYPCGFIGGVIIGTTKISEFLSAMNKLHAPKSFTIPFAIMLRYIPTIREDWHFIKDAMRLRDVSPNIKGLLRRPAMTLECVYVPLMMAASKAADELSIASVTRGIENPMARTCYTEIRFRITDVLAASCFLAYFILGRFL